MKNRESQIGYLKDIYNKMVDIHMTHSGSDDTEPSFDLLLGEYWIAKKSAGEFDSVVEWLRIDGHDWGVGDLYSNISKGLLAQIKVESRDYYCENIRDEVSLSDLRKLKVFLGEINKKNKGDFEFEVKINDLLNPIVELTISEE